MWAGTTAVELGMAAHAETQPLCRPAPSRGICRYFADLTGRGFIPNAAAALALKLHYGKGMPASQQALTIAVIKRHLPLETL